MANAYKSYNFRLNSKCSGAFIIASCRNCKIHAIDLDVHMNTLAAHTHTWRVLYGIQISSMPKETTTAAPVKP